MTDWTRERYESRVQILVRRFKRGVFRFANVAVRGTSTSSGLRVIQIKVGGWFSIIEVIVLDQEEPACYFRWGEPGPKSIAPPWERHTCADTNRRPFDQFERALGDIASRMAMLAPRCPPSIMKFTRRALGLELDQLQIVVLKGKHASSYFATPVHGIPSVMLKVLRQRVEDGYTRPHVLGEEPQRPEPPEIEEGWPEEYVAQLEGDHARALRRWSFARLRFEEALDDNRLLESALGGNVHDAYEIMERRRDHEYEGFDIEENGVAG
jgi:hypothetical protein